jgi:CRP/FNR family transcriptional regulator, cyclic AMP receptor protein
MVNTGARRKIPPSAAETLFGQSISEPLRHLLGQYPIPARPTEYQLRRVRASKNARSMFEKGTILFREGELPRGACIVLAGRVKKSITSAQGRTLVIGFCGPGSVVGLEANVLGRAYMVTAETVQRTEALVVPRRELIREMQTNATAAWQVAQLLAESSCFLLGKLGNMELSESAPQTIARCFLGWGASGDGQRVPLDISQETIAQMLGLSRETVSRQLAQLRRAGVLEWNRTSFVIWDREALEKLANLSHAAA